MARVTFVNDYNFLTRHETLKGETPAGFAGVREGIESWSDLVEGGLRGPKRNPEVPLEGYQRFEVGSGVRGGKREKIF